MDDSDKRKYRVLIAKVGLDGHDVGARVVARALADAGFEVVYTGLRQTPVMIVDTAIQEDVDVIGVSILSGAHMVFLPAIMELLDEYGARDINVVCGGVIPVEDFAELESLGLGGIFTAGCATSEFVSKIYELCQNRQT